MTEEEWDACTEPGEMLEFLRKGRKLSKRKGRLFAVACCRRVWHLLADERSTKAVELAGRMCDRLARQWELQDAVEAAFYAAHEADWPAEGAASVSQVRAWNAAEAAYYVASNEYHLSSGYALNVYIEENVAHSREAHAQARLLRDLLGTRPFRRPPPLGPHIVAWEGGLVVRLAEAAYAERELPGGHLDEARLAVLADALEDAGCTDDRLLAHLRSPGPHVRGCHAADWILGRQ